MKTPTYTVNFHDAESYVGNRPWVDLYLDGPGGPRGRKRALIANALVDTGADYSQLPMHAAQYVGLDPHIRDRQVLISTAGGKVLMHRLDVDLTLLGRTVTVRVHFGPLAVPLIGRQTLLVAMHTVGFQGKRWLQEW